MADNKKAEKKYFTLDHDKKFITVDTTIKPAKGDEEAVALYVKMGYKMRIKSQKRAEEMRKKADGLDADAIKLALKDDEEALKKFDDIIHGKKTNDDGKTGFFAAKKWYKEYINK